MYTNQQNAVTYLPCSSKSLLRYSHRHISNNNICIKEQVSVSIVMSFIVSVVALTLTLTHLDSAA